VGGAWRPGGTLEYSPALALLQVSALPALLTGVRRGSTAVRVAAAGGLAVALAVLGLSASRAEVALAAVVCLVAAARTLGGRGRAGGLGSARAARRRGRAGLALLGTALVLATAASVALAMGGAHAGEPGGGFWHGRLHTWRAAVETAADRPLTGAGADAFLAASARHQREGPVRFAHSLPLELAAELGILGALLAAALYAAAGAAAWRARGTPAAWLLGPAVAAFLAASLVDWPWHLAGSGAVFALALGALAGGRPQPSIACAPRIARVNWGNG
jgi:O-antigen ligase